MCISMTDASESDLSALAAQFADPDGAGPRAGIDVSGTGAAGTGAAGAEHGASVPTGSAPAGA